MTEQLCSKCNIGGDCVAFICKHECHKKGNKYYGKYP